MRAFSINYDLKVPGRDYSRLYDEIKRSSKWWHYLDSTWIVITNESAQQIWNRLAKHIDKNDYILIVEILDNVQGWLPKDAWKWIRANVPGR